MPPVKPLQLRNLVLSVLLLLLRAAHAAARRERGT